MLSGHRFLRSNEQTERGYRHGVRIRATQLSCSGACKGTLVVALEFGNVIALESTVRRGRTTLPVYLATIPVNSVPRRSCLLHEFQVANAGVIDEGCRERRESEGLS